MTGYRTKKKKKKKIENTNNNKRTISYPIIQPQPLNLIAPYTEKVDTFVGPNDIRDD